MKRTYEKPQVDIVIFESVEPFAADESGMIGPPQGILSTVEGMFETAEDTLFEF